MLSQDFLNLKLTRLKAPATWTPPQPGLCLLFPSAGSAVFTCGADTQPLGPGEVHVSDTSGGGTLSVSKGSEFAFNWFIVSVDQLFPLFSSTEISLLQNVTEKFKGARFYPASTTVAQQSHRLLMELSPQFNLEHRSQLVRVAALVLAEEFQAAQNQRVGFVRMEDHILQVFEKLSTEELLSLSVDDLADRFGCSRRHLNRLFHQYFGFSVASMRMELRLLKAVSLLRDPDAKVINVAEKCGFNHLGLFNTCFKKRFGVSPGQWRAANGAGKPAAELKGRPPKSEPTPHICPLVSNGLCPMTGEHFLNPKTGRPTPSPLAAPAHVTPHTLGAPVPSPAHAQDASHKTHPTPQPQPQLSTRAQ